MMNKFHGVSELIAFLMVVLGIVLGPMVERPHAYVLSSEQLLQFMAAHFSKFETLVLTHSVERESQEGVKDFEEILTMKSPDLLHAETKDPSVNQGRVVDRSYRRLFLASTQSKVSALLSGAGVNTEKVSFTRVDGTIAYLIGDARPDSPKLEIPAAPLCLPIPPRRERGSRQGDVPGLQAG
jgi:hypothetical protein